MRAMSLADKLPCKVSPRSRLLPGPLAPIFPAHAARYTMSMTILLSWTQEILSRFVRRDEREKEIIRKASRHVEKAGSKAVHDALLMVLLQHDARRRGPRLTTAT